MSLFRSKRSTEVKTAEVEDLSGEPLDTLAEILRLLGDFTFDLSDLDAKTARASYEAWSRHILIGTPPPGLEAADGGTRGLSRDWLGLRNFAADHRRRENAYVVSSLADFRQIIWIFIQGLARSVIADSEANETLSKRLDQLRHAIDLNDTSILKEAALSSISAIEETVSRRRTREQEQIEMLSSRVNRMSSELLDVREQLALDPLTELYNRSSLDDQLERIAQLGSMFGHAAILFMIDIDHFKWVNDTYGHQCGDEVLRAVAQCLKRQFRRRGDFVSRCGGDEFVAVILEHSIEAATKLADDLLFSVRDMAVKHGSAEIRVSVSIGVAQLVPGEPHARWVDRADRALYDAKEQGRDRAIIST